MSDTLTASAVSPDLLAEVSRLGVAILTVPLDHSRRRQLLARHVPCLRLIGAEDPAPDDWSTLEDWVRLPADPEEVLARAETLSQRALIDPPQLEVDDGVLHLGDARVILSPLEGRLVEVLIEELGRVVDRDSLTDAAWPDARPDDERALDSRIKLLRRRLAGQPLAIRTVRGRGYLAQLAS